MPKDNVIRRVALIAVTLLFVGCSASSNSTKVEKGANMSDDAYTALRSLALSMTPKALGLSAPPPAHHAYMGVADLSLKSGIATVVAGLGGEASIYLSNGGGSIGGEGNESVRAAARDAVEAATAALGEMHRTTEYPLPTHDDVSFYVLTTGGVMTVSTSEATLHDTSKPLGRLYAAVQDVVTKYRSAP